MLEFKKMDISTIFRSQPVITLDERSKLKDKKPEQQFYRVDRTPNFLLDKRYALNLDELV
jgi:hypothetical protein